MACVACGADPAGGQQNRGGTGGTGSGGTDAGAEAQAGGGESDLPYAREIVSFEPGEGAGFGEDDLPDVVLGPPDGRGELSGSLDVLSLGKGGSIVLGFGELGIADGEGPDFVVFENAFWPGGDPTLVFAEPGEVSVSEDGTEWHTFPCDAEGDGMGRFEGCAGVDTRARIRRERDRAARSRRYGRRRIRPRRRGRRPRALRAHHRRLERRCRAVGGVRPRRGRDRQRRVTRGRAVRPFHARRRCVSRRSPEPARAEEAAPVEVEVRGSPVSPASLPKDPSVAASTVRRDELEGPGRSAADVLRGEVGLTIAETGGLGAASTASVRGATAAETPVYLAGVRINDDVAGAADPFDAAALAHRSRGNLSRQRAARSGSLRHRRSHFLRAVRPREPLAGFGALVGSHGSRAAWTFAATGARSHALLLGVRFEGADNDYRFENDRGTLFDSSDDRIDRLQNADATVLDVWALGNARVGDGTAAGHFHLVCLYGRATGSVVAQHSQGQTLRKSPVTGSTR